MGSRNADGLRVLDFVKVNNLAVMNTYYQHRKSHKWTWYKYNYQLQSYTQRSIIDLFLTNNNALFLDVKVVTSVSMDADHRLVMAIVRIKKLEYTGSVGSKRYKLAELNDPEQVERLKGAIKEKLLEDDGREENIEALWRQFKEKITETADEILSEKKPY